MTTTPVHPEKSIDLFCEFFRGQIALIGAGNFSELTDLCKRLLLCCVLDALARASFPGEKEIGKRFTRLVREYASWPHSAKVSLTHLRKLLALGEAMKDPRFDNIRKAVESMPAWSEHQGVAISEDPDFSQIDNLWPKENGEPGKVRKLWAESLRHDYLFYKFRNNLVHEFNAAEISGYSIPEEPYYRPGRHELYYPTEFIVALARKAIDNLEPHFKRNNCNPRDVFKYGHFLVEELNNP